MTRKTLKAGITRRDLIKSFGFVAFLLTPVARAIAGSRYSWANA